MVKKILVAILFLFLSLSFKLPVAFAASEFATSYDVSYVVGTDGITDVTEKITLKNLTPQYYASSFSLTIGSTQISNVTASDEGGIMEIDTKKEGTATTFTVKFNQQIAGKDKQVPFTFRFKSKDFASKQGAVWEVFTPKIAETENLENYNYSLSIPQTFGEVTAISPTPISTVQSNGYQIFKFSREALLQGGVSANFGTVQIYEFSLNYPLKNPNPVSILTNIPIPPDTAYQDIIYTSIDPLPVNVTVDTDGNYLAWYKLGKLEEINVKVNGLAKLYINSKIKNPNLPAGLIDNYTKAQKFWEKEHASIKTKLSEILKGSPKDLSNYEKAKSIHKAVVNSLQYDTERVKNNNFERLGGVTALINPNSSICQEFTDLFIALVRAAGIPARELDGFAYSPNLELRPLSLSKDILHAWPEFWDDKKGWVMVDPTWENTTGGVDYFNKFDLNHFVFAIKGSSSTQPILGAKDVKVEFSEEDFKLGPKLDVEIISPNLILAGFPNKLKVIIKNSGSSLQQSSSVTASSGQIIIIGQNRETGPIPAYGMAEFEYDLRTKNLLDDYKDVIEITVAGQKIKKEAEVKPFILFRSFPFILISLISLIGLLYFGVLGGLIIRRRVLKIKSNEIKHSS